MAGELSQAERTEMEKVIQGLPGAVYSDLEVMWLAGRDFGREREEELRLLEHRASVRHQEERIRGEKAEKRERALEGALRRLLVSALPTRTDAERDAAVENALDLLAASPGEPEGQSARGRRVVEPDGSDGNMVVAQPDHGPGEPSDDTKRPDAICGVVCACGPNGEPMACGYKKGHEGAHSWASLPTWTDRWRIVHQPHRDPKKSSLAIEGPPCGSQVVYGVAMDRGVPTHERVRDTKQEAAEIAALFSGDSEPS